MAEERRHVGCDCVEIGVGEIMIVQEQVLF